ncbi:MAG TPA: hypothetical protein PLS30_05465 [Flavobacteriales bacterium]|nr:hypothetical protein [Flavobacteriales bacterium]
MIKLKVFVGYQIRSRYHRPIVFRKLIAEVNRILARRNPAVQLVAQFGEFPPGAKVWDSVTAALTEADLTIFDISENNPNVMVEAGIAVGSDTHVIFTKCSESKADYPLPSDLSSFIYHEYRDTDALLSTPSCKSLVAAVLNFVNRAHDPEFYLRSLWSLAPHLRTLIIPGKLPKDMVSNTFEDYIQLRECSDLDAIMIVFETLHRLYPNMEVSVHSHMSLGSLPKNWPEHNIVMIGGPDFNPLVSSFSEKCPYEYVYGKKGEPAVWLRHRQSGKELKPTFLRDLRPQRAIDHGFFYKTKLNHGPAKLIVFGGARTWGVCGAAQFAGLTGSAHDSDSTRDAKKLVRHFGSDPSFVIPLKVTGTEEGILSVNWTLSHVELV